MLGLVAPNLAHELYPDLEVGLVAQFCTAHEFPEAYVGDVPTFGITKEERAEKERKEVWAVKKLVQELPPYWADLLRRYEDQVEPEARFVRVVDKIMPSIMHIHGDGNKVFGETYNVYTTEEFYEVMGDYRAVLKAEYPEYPELHDIRNQLIDDALVKMFGRT